MSVVGIRARFPSGMYRGHVGAGQYDVLPSPLRLHSALVAAAGDGTTAEEHAGMLRRSAAATRALEWLEDNPPTYVELPPVAENGSGTDKAFAYLDEGVVENVKSAPSRRRTPRIVVDSTAIRGPLGWGWEQMPDDVAATLELLCADVGCLGEADSPVVLELTQIEPTHRRSVSTSPFAPVAMRLRVPGSGRLGELDDLYEAAQPIRCPSVSADKWTASETPSPSLTSHQRSIEVGYDRIDAPDSITRAPWSTVIFFPISLEIDSDEYVGWAVAMHRALVSALGDEASPVVTGRYEHGAVRHANRVAVQVLPRAVMSLSRHQGLGSGIALLIPDGEALAAVHPALVSLRRLYRGRVGALELGRPVELAGGDFWKPVAADHVRTWVATPVVIPETRRQKAGSRRWTLADSALLSVGFVFRDELDASEIDDSAAKLTGAQRYASIVDAVRARSVRPLNTSIIASSRTAKYVHKTPPGVVVQPYRLSITAGDLIPATAIVAVGQSRHLGGGLLVPLDFPSVVAQAWGVSA